LAKTLAEGHFAFAVEMDPPRGVLTHRLLAGAELLAAAGAEVINVADSPMARMRMSPWAVCALIQERVNIETTLHFPTRGRNLLRVQGDLLASHALGIRNIFAVMGDPTAIGDYPEAMDDYDVVPSGLIKLIRKNFNRGVDLSGTDIGEPTTFFVGGALNLTPKNPEREIKVMRRKIRAGVDFFLTQPVFDPLLAKSFIDRYQDTWGPLQVPVLAGILPLFSSRHAWFLHNEVPGITIAQDIMADMQKAGKASHKVGVQIAIDLISQIREWAQGIYLMPAFDRFDLAADIVRAFHEQ
jgi:homocysteine S-methyltransferase